MQWCDGGRGPGVIALVGIGPGGLEHLTYKARNTLEETEVVVGYKTYIKLIQPLLSGKEVIGSGMRQEVKRGQKAVEEALQGKRVCVISSGDAGVYGMSGLVLEILAKLDPKGTVEVEIVPGVTAANAAAACLGAPLVNDYATISLSDLLTPWEVIKKRVALAAEADFVLALYNPKSRKRVAQIEEVQQILLQYRLGDAPVGIVQNACREGQKVILSDLQNFTSEEINMFSLVVVGNSQTTIINESMITPRGYRL